MIRGLSGSNRFIAEIPLQGSNLNLRIRERAAKNFEIEGAWARDSIHVSGFRVLGFRVLGFRV